MLSKKYGIGTKLICQGKEYKSVPGVILKLFSVTEHEIYYAHNVKMPTIGISNNCWHFNIY